jgi:PGF-CTERM protein
VNPSDLEDVGDVTDAVEAGTITPDSSIVPGDHLILAIEAQGLEGALAEEGSSSATGQFAGIHNELGASADSPLEDAVQIRIEQTNPGPNQNAELVTVENTDYLTVIPDTENETYYAVVNTDGGLANGDAANPVAVTNGDGQLSDGDNYGLEFKVISYSVNDDNWGLVGPNADGDLENETVSAGPFSINAADASLNNADDLGVQAGENVTFSGTSNLAPNSELTVTVETERDEPSQFIDDTTVTVDADGTWEATFETTFVNAIEGTDFDITVEQAENAGSDPLIDESGTVEGPPTVNALTFNDQEVVATGTQTVVVQNVNLSEGGFIAIHQGGAGGPVIGNSDYIAEGTSRTNIPIALSETLPQGETTLVAMAHLDTDGDQTYEFAGGSLDGPYPGDNFVSSATITAGQPTTTATPTTTTATPTDTTTEPTETTTEPTETEPPETEPPADDTTTDGAGSPGFGVTAAIVALLGAALLALRRRA